MRKLSLYLETSIISAVIDDREPEKRKLTLRLLDEIKRGAYELFISELVTAEVDKSATAAALKLQDVLKNIQAEELGINDEVRILADKYISEGIIPLKYRNDALHIAVASVNELDVIVSWNFEHIVRLKTKREVLGINVFMGYKEIDIYSPLEVIKDVSAI